MARFDYNQRFLDSNGDPLSGGKLYTYDPGTTNDKATYSDAAQTTANTNPVILDANGLMPDIFFSGSIKLVIKDSNDVQINVIDPVGGDSLTSAEVKVLYEDNPNTNAFTDNDETKLDGIEALADVTDEANVTGALDGATLTDVTLAADDKVLMQDTSNSDELVTADAGDFGTNPVLSYTGLANGEYTGTTIELTKKSGSTLPAHSPVLRSGTTTNKDIAVCTVGGRSSAAAMGLSLNTSSLGTADTSAVDVLLLGFVRNTSWTWTVGDPVFVNGYSGVLSQTRPTTGGLFTSQVGMAVDTDILHINPGSSMAV